MADWFRAPNVTPLNPSTQHLAIFRKEPLQSRRRPDANANTRFVGTRVVGCLRLLLGFSAWVIG